MKLYQVKISPCCRAVWLYCLHNKLDIELIDVDIFGGELSKPMFRALNAYGEVPVLVDGELIVANAVPIILYLAEKYTNFSCFGISKSQEMKVKSMLDWASSKLHQTAGYRLVYPNFLEPYQLEDDATESLIEKGTVELTSLLESIERIFLASDQYLTGDLPTIADYYIATVIVQLEWINFDLKLWPKLNNWLVNIKKSEYWSLVHEKHEGFLIEMTKHED
ncbi:glutathione S-transferase theta-1-like [Hydra vulgaris]|uniref:Glutathione S-transferase theta-1-like n=1 Tax=Hydra vulgaris TaxID=6087 RepID=A0ABM4BXD5_HYDVU